MLRALVLTAAVAASTVTLACVPAVAQAPAKNAPPATLRSILLEQLRSTHNKAEWFTPMNAAVAGMTPEQARWIPQNAAGKVDPENNHSVGMLAAHLVFWNERSLLEVKGEKPAAFGGNNDETFNNFDAKRWTDIVARLDRVMTGFEQWTEKATDAQLQAAATRLAHVGTHNAYHTGQILYVRKLQGSWNPANGVK
ncbi:hypothetical protein Terro_1067 [Terriglobus roseus DSM 18391]|uniref:DinB-like domain-containing protein n=1 Tax=Terriglobus roseus (strain DSM 18391 / NRRL B-41598 / KBS 63) TaxID=926566 RepID=I3ZDS0_TERRK|nr:DinB family protein [Terriglobus roseus]AFL87388.1 hypothetical protein Terro_1067 [Terriglobus roseus DSM 18391]